MDLTAGLYTQVQQLRKILQTLDPRKTDPNQIKSYADALGALEQRLEKQNEKRKIRQLEKQTKEKQNLEVNKAAEPLQPQLTTNTKATPDMLPPPVPEHDLGTLETPAAQEVEGGPYHKTLSFEQEGMTVTITQQASGHYVMVILDPAGNIVYHTNSIGGAPDMTLEQLKQDVIKDWGTIKNDLMYDEKHQEDYTMQDAHHEDQKREWENEVPTKPLSQQPGRLSSRDTIQETKKEADVNLYALDSYVEPIKGTPGSYGRVMRHDAANDLVYVAWESGKLKELHGFGGYDPKEVRVLADKAKQEYMMKDLKDEHAKETNPTWKARLEQKIKDLEDAMSKTALQFPEDGDDMTPAQPQDPMERNTGYGGDRSGVNVAPKTDDVSLAANKFEAMGREWTVEPMYNMDDPKGSSLQGYNIYNESGQKIMTFKTNQQMSDEQLSNALVNEYQKKHNQTMPMPPQSGMSRLLQPGTLKEDLAILRKGSKVRIIKVDAKHGKVTFASIDNPGVTGIAPLDKFALGKMIKHEGHDDEVLQEHNKEFLVVCNADGEVVWVHQDPEMALDVDVEKDSAAKTAIDYTDVPSPTVERPGEDPRKSMPAMIRQIVKATGMMTPDQLSTTVTNPEDVKPYTYQVTEFNMANGQMQNKVIPMKETKGRVKGDVQFEKTDAIGQWKPIDQAEFEMWKQMWMETNRKNYGETNVATKSLSKRDDIVRLRKATLTRLAKECPDCYAKFLKFAKEKGLKIELEGNELMSVEPQTQSIEQHVQQMRERINTVKERFTAEASKGVKADHPHVQDTNPDGTPIMDEQGTHPVETPAVEDTIKMMETDLDMVENAYKDKPEVVQHIEKIEEAIKQLEQMVGIGTGAPGTEQDMGVMPLEQPAIAAPGVEQSMPNMPGTASEKTTEVTVEADSPGTPPTTPAPVGFRYAWEPKTMKWIMVQDDNAQSGGY